MDSDHDRGGLYLIFSYVWFEIPAKSAYRATEILRKNKISNRI